MKSHRRNHQLGLGGVGILCFYSICGGAIFGTAPGSAYASRSFEDVHAVGIRADGYLTSGVATGSQPDRLNTVTSVEAEISQEARLSGGWDLGVDALGIFYIQDAKDSAVAVREAWVGWQSEWVRVDLGSRNQSWNLLDQEWSLGVWQPRVRKDYLRPIEMGLPGAYFTAQPVIPELGGARVSFTAFGSVLHLPDLGPRFDLEDGRFVAYSPWFWTPPESLRIYGQNTQTDYDVALPAAADVLLRPSLGVSVRVSSADEAFSAQAAYAYKTANQFFFAYDGFLRLPGTAEVTLYPRILNHHVGSADVTARVQNLGFWVSGLVERPVADLPAPEWTVQQVADQNAFASAGAELQVDDFLGRGRPAILRASVLKVWAEDLPDNGPLASDGETIFEPRFFYEEALSLGARFPYRFSRGEFRLNARWIRDFSVGGSLWSSELAYRSAARWEVRVGADWITADSAPGTPVGAGSGFFERYRANDRVWGGASYAF